MLGKIGLGGIYKGYLAVWSIPYPADQRMDKQKIISDL